MDVAYFVFPCLIMSVGVFVGLVCLLEGPRR